MYSFIEEADKKSFDGFVINNGGSYLQCSSWPNVKAAWRSRLFSGFEDGKRVLTCLVMERRIPVVGAVWYISCGPVCNYADEKLHREFARFISDQMENAGAACAVIDPLIPLRINGETTAEGPAAHRLLLSCGYELNTDIESYTYKHPVQYYLHLKDESGSPLPIEKIVKKFDKGVRYSIRTAPQRGLIYKTYYNDEIQSSPKIIEDFLGVMRDTSDRNNFVARDAGYCKNLVANFSSSTEITLVYYDRQLDSRLEKDRLEKKEKAVLALETAPEKRKNALREEILSVDKQTEHYQLRLKEIENFPENELICVAGGLTIRYNGIASCVFGGTKNLLRNNSRSSQYFNYVRIQKSLEDGCDIHDLGYVLVTSPETNSPGEPLGELRPREDFEGICEFKRSFGADRYDFIGEYILVGSKFRYLIYKNLMPKAKKLKVGLFKLLKGGKS